MRPDERDPAHLWDMVESARAVLRILGDLSLAQFLEAEGETVRLAVERKLEILGEAARRVSDGFRDAHPEVSWKDVIGLRNVISHQYNKRGLPGDIPDCARADAGTGPDVGGAASAASEGGRVIELGFACEGEFPVEASAGSRTAWSAGPQLGRTSLVSPITL